MTLRDEIAKALAASNSWMLAHECRDSADALLPIVERAVREAAIAGWAARVFSERGQSYESTDAIVARVMEGGE